MKVKQSSKTSSVRLTSHIIPERYKIFLKPDLDNFIFEGEETIYLKLEKPTKKITLHASELEIEGIEFVYNETLRQAQGISLAGKISYNEKAETATFTFAKQIPSGTGELRLKFKGILNDRMRGFYRSQYTVDGQVKNMATTQFESTDARRAFPCFDEPSQKAIFDVTLMVPAHTVAISNTLETVVTEHDGGFKTVEFAPTPKMSTYLLAFIVGEFEYIEGKSKNGTLVRIFTTPGKKKQAEFALDTSIRCLEFYEEYFDIKYPLPVLDLIAIPDFSAGAMENWGAVTYRESALLVDPEHSSLGNKQWVALVIAHELAHQWFGNLVTMKWWTHLWLNEGFASFIEYLAVDHLFPDWDIWTQFTYLDQGAALELDGLSNTHPIEVEVHHPAEISEIFDKVSYSKGASVIRMLENYIGEKDFRKGLSLYLKKYQYSNASTQDLWASFEQSSGKPVKEVMKNWTSKPGYPLLTIKEKRNSTKLELSQVRFFSSAISGKGVKNKTVWKIPLVITGKNKNADTKEILIEQKAISINKPKEGDWLKLNSGEVSFVRVDYPAKYLHLLKNAVEGKEISAVDRLGVIRDAFALSEAGKLPTQEALYLALSYKNEENLTVWNEISSGINKIHNLVANEGVEEEFNAYAREVFATIAKKMGWKKRKGEKHTDVMLRSLVLHNLGKFGDQSIIQKARDLFQSHLRHAELGLYPAKQGHSASSNNKTLKQVQGDRLDPDLKGVVYNLVAENGGAREHQTFIDLYKKETNQQEQTRLSKALASFKDPKLLQNTLEFAFSKEVRLQDASHFVVYTWSNPKGRDITWKFVQKRWKFLREKLAGGYLLSRMLGAAGVFTEIKKANEISKFFDENPAPDVKRTVQQVIEQIYSNAEWLKRDGKGIKKFLENYSN